MIQSIKVGFFWLIVAVSAALLWQVVHSNSSGSRPPEITYSTFISEAQSGRIAQVSITGTRIEGEYRDGQRFRLVGPNNPAVFLSILQDKGVEIRFKDAPAQSLLLQLLGSWAPLLLLAAVWFAMIRQLRRRNAPPAPSTAGTIDVMGGPR